MHNIAGSLTLAVTNPIWIAKTRLCLEYESTGPRYRGMLHVVSDLYRNDGVKGLYKVSGTKCVVRTQASVLHPLSAHSAP